MPAPQYTTRASLLARVRDPHDSAAWREFYMLYAPLMYRYARGKGLSREDAEEVRDQCLLIVTKKIPFFDYDCERGRFKSWLFRVVNGKVIDFLRKRKLPITDSHTLRNKRCRFQQPDELWERHWRGQHLRFVVDQIKPLFSDKSYQAFYLLIFEERSVDYICQRLDMKRNQVYKCKARIINRMRQKLACLDEELSMLK